MSLQPFPEPGQRDSRTLPSRDPKFAIPAITFGLEQEFNFAMPHTLFEHFLETNRGPILTLRYNPHSFPTSQQSAPPSQQSASSPSAASSSHASGSEKTTFVRAHLRYVLALLNHQLDFVDTYQKDSVLPTVSMQHPKKHTYDAYSLVLDDSVMPKVEAQMKVIEKVDIYKWREERGAVQGRSDVVGEPAEDRGSVSARGGEDPEEMLVRIKRDWDRVGGELVSKIFQLHQQELWMACCQQVDSDLKWDKKVQHGAWVDDDPHLHVHMALAERNSIPLRTIKGVIALYGLFENEIERWHPASQRTSGYCMSLRLGTDLRPYTPQGFTEKVYSTTTASELKDLVYARNFRKLDSEDDQSIDSSQWKNYVHVNISLPRFSKSTELKQQTLEFRHHRGTLDAEEIKWWVLFCGSLLSYAYFLGEIQIKVVDEPHDPYDDEDDDERGNFVGDLTKRSILDIIGFPEEGKAFFERKKEEYHDEAWERKTTFENEKIRMRLEMKARGMPLGQAMERAIRKSDWHVNALKEKKKADEEDKKEKARIAERNAKLDYRAAKEQRRVLVLKAREKEKVEQRMRARQPRIQNNGEERARLFKQWSPDDGSERMDTEGLEAEQFSNVKLPKQRYPRKPSRHLFLEKYPIHEVERNGVRGHFDRAFDPPRFIPKVTPEETRRIPRSRSRSRSTSSSKRRKLTDDSVGGLDASIADAPAELISPRAAMKRYRSLAAERERPTSEF